jgi:hypothetical protein
MSLSEIRGCAPQDLVLLLEQLDPLMSLAKLRGLTARSPDPDFGDDSRSSMTSQRFRHDGEMPKSFATWATDASEFR